MAKLILSVVAGVATAGASFFLVSAFHRRVGRLFGPTVRQGLSAPSEGEEPTKQERRHALSVTTSVWTSVFYAIMLGLLAGLMVWQAA